MLMESPKMITVLVMISLCSFHLASSAPGVKVRITQAGLDHAGKIAMDTVTSHLKESPIKDVSGSCHSKRKNVNVNYKFYNIKVDYFQEPGSHVSMIPGKGIQLTTSGGSLKLSANWQYSYKLFFVKLYNIHKLIVDTTISGINFNLGIALGNSNGRPTISVTSCSCSISYINVVFHRGLSWLYNLFSPEVEKRLKSELTAQACKGARKAINIKANHQLEGIVKVPIGDVLELDYSLTEEPYCSKNFLESHHKGEVTWRGDNHQSSLMPPPIPTTSETNKMVYIWLSDYVMNTMGEVLHRHGVMKYELTKKDLPAKERTILDTDCTFFCLGSTIPQLKKKYPKGDVSLKLETTKPPQMEITTTHIGGIFSGLISAYVRLPSGRKTPLFNSTTTVTLNLNLEIVNNKITTTVQNLHAKDFVITSTTVDVTAEHVQWLFNHAIKGFMLHNMKGMGADGFYLPALPNGKFVDPEIVLMENNVLLMMDVEREP